MRYSEITDLDENILAEIGDAPAEYEPNRRRRRSLFHATVDDQWVDVFFDRSALTDSLQITFTVNQNYEAPAQPTRASGSVIRILSTVLNIIREQLPQYMRSARPPRVTFTAKGASRIDLYKRYFVPVIQEILGDQWQLEIVPGDMTLFAWSPDNTKKPKTVSEVNSPGELSVDSDLIQRFTDAGWQIDGEGRDQIVMSRPGTNRVLKIVGQGTGNHINEIRNYVEFFRRNQRNPHFPRVGPDRTFNWKGQQYYVYTQERLAPLSSDEEILDYLEYVMGEIGHGEDPDYGRTPPGLTVEQVDGLVSAIYDMFDERMLTQYNFDLGNTANIMQRANGQLVIVDPASDFVEVNENFADGKVKGKSRPGRVKRAGASCKGSVTDLRARAKKYGGEKGKMYHWCANMKSGRKK